MLNYKNFLRYLLAWEQTVSSRNLTFPQSLGLGFSPAWSSRDLHWENLWSGCCTVKSWLLLAMTVHIIIDYIWCQTCEDSADRPGGVPGVGVIVWDWEAQPCVWLEPGVGGMAILDSKSSRFRLNRIISNCSWTLTCHLELSYILKAAWREILRGKLLFILINLAPITCLRGRPAFRDTFHLCINCPLDPCWQKNMFFSNSSLANQHSTWQYEMYSILHLTT